MRLEMGMAQTVKINNYSNLSILYLLCLVYIYNNGYSKGNKTIRVKDEL